MKQQTILKMVAAMGPAAFGRLCVETSAQWLNRAYRDQPPSGGCVLKHLVAV
ncbi:hypothetical protein [Neisseria mucosa]|uniref:hypothetical protein n=1 Tax=Neisseria mucosa TaxID=488 RepID=UPI003FA0E18C